MAIPISLLVDDGAPVNPMVFHDAPHEHPLRIPPSFVADFAAVCERYGARGKFSVLPMPLGLGDLNRRVNHVPARDLAAFLRLLRRRVAPRFDITPEILTHLAAYRFEGGFHHLYEDEWVARAGEEEIANYVALALEILVDVDLPANGVTSPWSTGNRNEDVYARAIGAAQRRVHRRPVTWYFLHVAGAGPAHRPSVTWRNPGNGQVVVSVPANTDDPFWGTQRPMARTLRQARAAARKGVDALLSPDGRGGRIPDVIAQGAPVTILTHWQSLFSDGTCAGLWGLDLLLARLTARYGPKIEWTLCSELAASVSGP
jgi:hypothetical protein